MEPISTSDIHLFEGFQLDRRRGGLFHADGHGGYVPVAIGSRALDLLDILVQRHGELVSKDEIMTAVWRGTVVAESNIPIQILALRRILDHGRGRGSCIQTVSGRGYRFVAPVMCASGHDLVGAPEIDTAAALVDHAFRAERRPVTVLSGGFLGFPLSSRELDPEDLRDVFEALHEALAEVVRRYGGYAANFDGEALLAYFGYPIAHEDDAERAVRAGLALIDATERFEVANRLQARIGIATGLVVIGDVIGKNKGSQPGVVGAALALATRLQALAQPSTLVIADSTQRQVGALFELDDLGALEPGDASRRIWRVRRERRGASRFEALRSGGYAPRRTG